MMQPQDSILIIPSQNCLARALYDNIAESPDELAFRKGDILVVLEQNTYGLEGWWLCTLRGRQGICPGNRLRLLAGVYTSDMISNRDSSPCSPAAMDMQDMGSLQRQGKRRSWHVQPNKVVTPKKYNDVYLYDMPANRCSPVQNIVEGLSLRDNGDSYDVPPRAVPLNYDMPRNWSRNSPAPSSISPNRRDSSDSYDVPRPLLLSQQQLTPSSSASSLTADSISSSNRSSVVNMPDYDIPKPRGPQLQLQPAQLYDVPLSNQLKELPLQLNSALDTLARLQTDSTSAISKLLSYVTPQWRQKDKLQPKLMDIKLTVVRLKTSVHDLAEFGDGALGNAARAPDKGLAIKLRPLVTALRNADRLVQNAAHDLDQQNWSIDILALRDDHSNNSSTHIPDALEQLVACSKALTEDVRQITSFIQGNSILLFKRSSSPHGNNNSEWTEDYDYVNFESKEITEKKHAEIRDSLPNELRKGYDELIKNAEYAAINNDSKSTNENELHSDEKQVLNFYAAQVITHHNYLTYAIDAFLQTVEHNQPPKVFLAHDKFVVLSAHKLVHIGDTVHRNITCADVRTRIINCANSLSDALAASVAKTKQAALQFPSVTAVQEMVDSVVDISHLARDLKLSLVQAAQP